MKNYMLYYIVYYYNWGVKLGMAQTRKKYTRQLHLMQMSDEFVENAMQFPCGHGEKSDDEDENWNKNWDGDWDKIIQKIRAENKNTESREPLDYPVSMCHTIDWIAHIKLLVNYDRLKEGVTSLYDIFEESNLNYIKLGMKLGESKMAESMIKHLRGMDKSYDFIAEVVQLSEETVREIIENGDERYISGLRADLAELGMDAEI